MFSVVHQEMFMRMVLGLDQQQVLTLLNGFVYHTFFLDAFAGLVPSLTVLHTVVYTFGLIGFTLLALQRSLWTPSIIVSWLVLILLLVLGSRGSDVLFSPLNRGSIDMAIKDCAFQDSVTTYSNAMESVRWIENGQETCVPMSSTSGAPGAKMAFPTTGEMMTKSLESAQIMAQGQDTQGSQGGGRTYKVSDIGAFTPMVFVLYTFNTMKKELLSGMSNRINVDILNRTGIANRIGAGKLYPSTQFLFRTFVDECSGGDLGEAMLGGGQINNAPESIGKLPLDNGKTVEQALTERIFTLQNLLSMMRNYFNDVKTPSYIKSFVGMPSGRPAMGSSAMTFENITTIPPAAMFGLFSYGATQSEKVLESYLSGQRQGDDSFYRNMRDIVSKADIAPDHPGLRRQAVVNVTAYKMLAGKPGQTSTEPGAGIEKETISFSNCWELYKVFYTSLNENFGGSQIEKRLGKMAFDAESKPLSSVNGKLVLSPTGAKKDDYLVALSALETKCKNACNYLGSNTQNCPACDFKTGICAPGLKDVSLGPIGIIANPTGSLANVASQASTCLAAQKEYVFARQLVDAGAIDVELGKIAAADDYFRDPKKMSSGVRDFTADMGKYLGPVAMWFFALFGGFAAGAYSAIVPSFMNFTLMMIFALTPFMFMMGVLMPAWAPQIILTPIVAVAYLKIVEIMFVLVGFVFAALRVGLENSGLITPPSWLMIFRGVDTFNAMYDIMIGMAYTSMFAIAGFMLVGVRSPEKLVGGLASLGDKTGKIDGSEVLKIGAASAAAFGAAKKVGGLGMKVYDRGQDAKFVAGQIKEKGLGKGLKDSATALTGSLSERGNKRQLTLQGRLDSIDNTNSEYGQQRQQSEIKREKRLLGLNLVDEATAENAYALEGNKQKQAAASKARTEGALRGAGQGEQVDKERYNRQTADGSVKGDTLYEKGRAQLVRAVTEKYRDDLRAQGLSEEDISGKLATLKADIQSEVDKLMITSASRLNLKGNKFMDDRDGIDYDTGEVKGTFDFSTAEGRAFAQTYGKHMEAAGFSAADGNGKRTLGYNLDKTTKRGQSAGNTGPGGAPGGTNNPGPGGAAPSGAAAAGSTPTGGRRAQWDATDAALAGTRFVSPNSMSIKQAIEQRDREKARQAGSAVDPNTAAAKKIANVVAEELGKALSGLGGAVSAAADGLVNEAQRSQNVEVIKEKFATNDRNMTETQRDRLTDPSNNSLVLEELNEKADQTLGIVSEIKDDLDKDLGR